MTEPQVTLTMKDLIHRGGSVHPVPFACSYWVVPGGFLAGFYPGSEVPEEAELKLTGLVSHGIRRVINLMEEDEANRFGRPFVSYEALLESYARAMGHRVVCERMPIPDMEVPSRSTMRAILDRIDGSIETSMPVYVHCLGGLGRTGTVAGCFLARHAAASGRGGAGTDPVASQRHRVS